MPGRPLGLGKIHQKGKVLLGGLRFWFGVLLKGTMTFGTQWEKLMGNCLRSDAEAMFMHYVNSGGGLK